MQKLLCWLDHHIWFYYQPIPNQQYMRRCKHCGIREEGHKEFQQDFVRCPDWFNKWGVTFNEVWVWERWK